MSHDRAAAPRLLWAERAWVDGRWRDAALLEVDAGGHWADVQPDTAPPASAHRLGGPVLPSLVDAHSHAFQRAFAGMAECLPEQASGSGDDFWSWRDRMYAVALRITPGQLRAVATQLYRELLAGGYTQVCEFHYLHHAPDGQRHEDPAAMSLALVEAAADAGIGLTLLPVLYERAGFTQPSLRPDQRRFRTDAADVLALVRAVHAARRTTAGGTAAAPLNTGVAIHSLRAARPQSMRALVDAAGAEIGAHGPIHIHVAEQTAEVEECLAVTGARPIEWLAREMPLDARWQLVHATHAVPAEIEAVAASGAGVVLCPGTEGNLGDGLCDLTGWLNAQVPLTVGSDSQVTRAWPEELRWLEYGQRLAHRRRNVAAAAGREPSSAARLFERMCRGGAAAAGLPHWGLQRGARADFVVLNLRSPPLAGVPQRHHLDAAVFSAGDSLFAQTWVAGRLACGPETTSEPLARAGATRPLSEPVGESFREAMQALWGR
ncbi:MAG: formimidoylglutamate deiminase [Rubrivivax sp.]|nr:formimidoylglutamate deiminase [Rubrivivax sp.]